MAQPRDIVKQETGARGVRLDGQGRVLEGVEVLLDLQVAAFGLGVDGRQRRGQGNLAALAFLARHQPFHIFGLGGLDAIAAGCLKENARVAQRDRHRHHVVVDVVDAEDGFLFFGVVGFNGDGHVLVGVDLDRGEGSGRLHRRRRVVGGQARRRQPKDQKQNSARIPHRARLYHSRVNQPMNWIRRSTIRPAGARFGNA